MQILASYLEGSLFLLARRRKVSIVFGVTYSILFLIEMLIRLPVPTAFQCNLIFSVDVSLVSARDLSEYFSFKSVLGYYSSLPELASRKISIGFCDA